MNFRTIKYHINQGFKSLSKNGLMSVASIASVLACSIILILFLTIAINLDTTLENMESNLGISVYLSETIDNERVLELYEEIKQIDNVKTLTYMSKEDALNWAKEQWGDDSNILTGLEDDNPFPRSFEIEISNSKYQKYVIDELKNIQQKLEEELIEKANAEKIGINNVIDNSVVNEIVSKQSDATEIKEQKENENISTSNEENVENDLIKKEDIGKPDYVYLGIESIKHTQTESQILLTINTTIRILSIIIILILSILSIAIIMNTIKLAVYVRRSEINIMKYVGATDRFIRGPFIVEGMLIGLIGSILPCIVFFFLYSRTVNIMYEKISFIQNYIDFKPALELFLIISPITILFGLFLGVIGSINSIKKHLNV